MLAFLVGHTLFAQNETANDLDGVLFRVEGKHLRKPSYLLGTVHVIHGDRIANIQNLNDILSSVEGIATELKPEWRTSTTAAQPKFALTPEETTRVTALFPIVLQEFNESGADNPYERFLTPQQLDSLDHAMKFLLVDSVMMTLQPDADNFDTAYRTANPLTLAQLAQTLFYVQQGRTYMSLGYSANYNPIDHAIMDYADRVNKEAADGGKHARRIVQTGLDSTYAWNQVVQSSANIKDLVNDCTSRRLASIIYRSFRKLYDTGIQLTTIDSLYTLGEGREIVKRMAAVEPEAYADPALVDGRNRYWMTQLPQLFNDQSTLVAVGLAHLLPTESSEGIVAMLRREGYKVTRIR